MVPREGRRRWNIYLQFPQDCLQSSPSDDNFWTQFQLKSPRMCLNGSEVDRDWFTGFLFWFTVICQNHTPIEKRRWLSCARTRQPCGPPTVNWARGLSVWVSCGAGNGICTLFLPQLAWLSDGGTTDQGLHREIQQGDRHHYHLIIIICTFCNSPPWLTNTPGSTCSLEYPRAKDSV